MKIKFPELVISKHFLAISARVLSATADEWEGRVNPRGRAEVPHSAAQCPLEAEANPVE